MEHINLGHSTSCLKGCHRCEKNVGQVSPKAGPEGNPRGNSADKDMDAEGSTKEINQDQKASYPKVTKFELVKSLKGLAAPRKVKNDRKT